MSARVDAMVREAYAAHQILFQLGYDPSEVWVTVAPVLNVIPAMQVCVIVKLIRGDKEFVMPVATVGSEKESKLFQKAWREFAARGKRRKTADELETMVRSSQIWARLPELLLSLEAKGFGVEYVEVFQ